MKVLFITSDLKLNNTIIDILSNHVNENIDVVELDYLDELTPNVFDKEKPDLVIISDKVTYEELENENKDLKDDALFVKMIEIRKFNPILITHKRSMKDTLVNNLIKNDLYRIYPSDNLEKIIEVPSSMEEVAQIFYEDKEILVKSVSKNDDKDFIVPPAAVYGMSETEEVRQSDTDKELVEPIKQVETEVQPIQSIQSIQEEQLYFPKVERFAQKSQPQFQEKPPYEMKRSLVSLFWSPIPNVGLGTFVRALGYTLAQAGRKVLMIELDWEYPKLARQTALTHTEKNLKEALLHLIGGDKNIQQYFVNNRIAEENLPHTHKLAKMRLKDLPETLYALSRNAEIKYEEEIEFDDDALIEKLFFYSKQAGFDHILVDVPSNPTHLFTSLALLCSDEKFAFVDDSFSTSRFFKSSMQVLSEIEIKEDDFELIINKTRDGIEGEVIAEHYGMEPVLSLPFCEDVAYLQLDLRVYAGEEYMKKVRSFAERYNIHSLEDEKSNKPRKLFKLFG